MGTVRDILDAVREHGKFAESPRERIIGLSKSLFLDPTLPNIALGLAFGASLQAAHGLVPLTYAAASWALWLVLVAVFVVGDEIVQAVAAARSTMQDEGDTPGIE